MNKHLTTLTMLMATLLTNPREVTKLLPRRDERGSNSIEQLIWIGAIVALAILITGLVATYVQSKMPTT